MVRIVILLAPVFISLFWAVNLMIDNKERHPSRRYFSYFMLVPAFLMFCHFLYFASFPDWFVWFDLPLQCLGMMVFPLYHIYFRLLTVDDKISLKRFMRFLAIPLIFSVAYGIAVFNAPLAEYKDWLFNKPVDRALPSVQFLQVMRIVLKIGFPVLLIYYTIANHLLIKKNADRAVQFYSNMRDAKTGYAKLLNLSILLSGLVTLVLFIIGRAFLISADGIIFMGWTTLTVTFYLMGSLGARQRVINPDVELIETMEPVQPFIPQLNDQDVLINRIMIEFRENKIYLNSELTIYDVGRAVGSNRTYMSGIINQKFNQNFCAFVNGFRIQELRQVLSENPDYTIEQFVMLCGFGSVNSMKRSVATVTGMSFSEFRVSVLMKKPA